MEAKAKPEIRPARADSVSTVFADGLYGASLVAGTVRLELLMEQFDPAAGALAPAIVGRLVMPTEKLEGFVRSLNELVQRLRDEKNQKKA